MNMANPDPSSVGSQTIANPTSPQPPRLLDRLRDTLQARHFTPVMVERYVDWCRRYILYYNKRHPQEMGAAEVNQFFAHLANSGTVSAGGQTEAWQALGILYRDLLRVDLGPLRPPRLLDQVREVLRVQHYALRTEECYVQWIKRFILFHGKRHPLEMGGREIEEFLTHLAVAGHVSASTQMQALNALVFLYHQVLQLELPRLDAVRAQRSRRLPVVLSREEVRLVLNAVEGCHGLYPLMTRLLYGAGLRLMECCRLRVKDVDFSRRQLLVRQGKGDKDRVVMLPRSLQPNLGKQFQARRELHERDLKRGIAFVPLPDALERKYPNAVKELGWQFVFASERLSRDPRTGNLGRHHVHENALQRAVTQAVRKSRLTKRIGCHTFRHSFATHLLERGVDLRTVQAVPC